MTDNIKLFIKATSPHNENVITMLEEWLEDAKDGKIISVGLIGKRQWVGLTDEERRQIALDDPIDWVAAIEAKLKEKNR